MGSVQHTPQTRARVIEEFLACGRVDLACERAGCDRSSHYAWLRAHEDYAEAFAQARLQTADLLEDEAFRRAYDGVDKPVFQQGRQVGMVREYSDTLMTWLLRGLRRERYGDKVEMSLTGSISVAEVLRQREAKLQAEDTTPPAIEAAAEPVE